MIGRLHGRLVLREPPSILIDCNGVGYEVEVPLNAFFGLPPVGELATLWVHMVVREDAQLLYGFVDLQQRVLFRRLIKISGVGAKMALAILSGMSASEFALCVQGGDVATLTRLPGVGKKTAERLIVEMRGKLDADALSAGDAGGMGQTGSVPVAASTEAISALEALGYKASEAAKMVSAASQGLDAPDAETLIRAALRATVKL